MVEISITQGRELSPAAAPVEMVERKGLGHPDTICDALAEELSLALCRFYRDRFGLILHHNVDKALLWGGVARPEFRGGEVAAPMEIFLAGRATREFKGVRVPVEELMVETGRQWLKEHFHALDPDKHIRFHAMIRPGSHELVELYLRQREAGMALANDTSCGVGYAPLDELEQLVLAVETRLNSPEVKAAHPAVGEDIKVMGVRNRDAISLTVACAFIGRYLDDIDDYMAKKVEVAALVRAVAEGMTSKPVTINVNTADGKDQESIYLTVTGTSAEAGDDGEVGRGNRVNGLITPYRPMNMEAAAGKNPVTHVGKLYNILAQQMTAHLVAELPEVETAQCYLVSRIGHPIDRPQIVDLRLGLREGGELGRLEGRVRDIVHHHLAELATLQVRLIERVITVY
jgi:S-adenosylmethionine synthetase